tara:strand:+ start:1314 stop:1898 length:585 start_codon:yes stop_codon:yes gene_type:complete
MFLKSKFTTRENIFKVGIAASLIGSCFCFEAINTGQKALAGLQFRWDQDSTYKKLSYIQTSMDRLDRSTYYFLLKKNQRKTAILKLSLKFPEYFKATIKRKKITLCKVKIGGYQGVTKCVEKLPAQIEIDKKMQTIEIYPDSPIPARKGDYGVILKIFNPRRAGMYQINTYAQSPGELPISYYLGSYLIEIAQD